MATINDLPNEIILHIFSYLRWRLIPLSCVCRRWDQLIVTTLRLCVRLCDDEGSGERGFVRRSFRQYERLMLMASGCTGKTQEVESRTGLWMLRRFHYAREVELEFKECNVKQILIFLNGLGPNVQRLKIHLSFFARISARLEPIGPVSEAASAPNLRYVHLINLSVPLSNQIYNWFQRNAPNIEGLQFCNCEQADIMISAYQSQLKELKISHLFSEADYNHLKCPNLLRFSFEIDTFSNNPIQLNSFFQNAPRLRYLELVSTSTCQNAVRAAAHLPNLEVLTLAAEVDMISFEEHDKFPAMKTFTIRSALHDAPQLPAARKLTIRKPTSDRFYARLIFRAPNLTHLVIEKDIFLGSESIVSICTGLKQLVELRLTIHPTAKLTLKAFDSVRLLRHLQHFYICLEDISKQKWLGCWFKKLHAPSVTIKCEHFGALSLKDFKLLLANRRTRVLTLERISVTEWHPAGRVRREAAQLRPDLQLLYLDPTTAQRWL